MAEKERVFKLTLSVESCERIEAMQANVQASSIADVIRRALALYDALLGLGQDGATLLIRHSDGTEQEVDLKSKWGN